MIADIILTAASMGFVGADLKQAWKLFKNKQYDTSLFSRTHFKLKITSLFLVIVAYAILQLPMAFIVAISQISINIYILARIGWYDPLKHLPKPFIETDVFKKLWNNEFDDRWDDVDLYGGDE